MSADARRMGHWGYHRHVYSASAREGDFFRAQDQLVDEMKSNLIHHNLRL